ncbi:MAG: guanosine-3',5'-bis(diphosphate) 3'-pyrophosphohydrolase [Mycobacterium sp.]|nr:guanosine-3',5'-bis(diphosphate) 3'-pyrophosphohydrolase [Mycobacterium sp.]
MNQQEVELIATAQRLCDQAHAGQLDKAGRPYGEHLRRVAGYVDVGNASAAAAALLHDVLEDSSMTSTDMAAAGIAADVIEVVELLTRRDDVPSDEYYRRIRRHPVAREVKLADLADNTDPDRLALLRSADRRRLMAKYAAAYAALGADQSDADHRRRPR